MPSKRKVANRRAEPDRKDYGTEFKMLSSLLTLVTAINNRGSSTMLGSTNRQPYYTTPLNAVTSVIVRRSEIIAAVADRSRVAAPTGPSSVPQPDLSATPPTLDPLPRNVSPAKELHVFAMAEDVEQEGEIQARFTAFANPRRGDRPGGKSDSSHCMLLVSGNSHWQTIKGDGLKGLLIECVHFPKNHVLLSFQPHTLRQCNV